MLLRPYTSLYLPVPASTLPHAIAPFEVNIEVKFKLVGPITGAEKSKG